MDSKGAGGTPGGFGQFFGGLVMVIAGGTLLLQTTVHSGFWSWFGDYSLGITLLPLLIGIGILFFNGGSRAGWVLVGLGALVIVLGIVANLRIYFRPTSLFNMLLILALMAGCVGLIARSLKGPAPPTQ